MDVEAEEPLPLPVLLLEAKDKEVEELLELFAFLQAIFLFRAIFDGDLEGDSMISSHNLISYLDNHEITRI